MKKLLGLFLIACISAVLGLGSTGCTKKQDTKTPDKKATVTTPPKDGDKKGTDVTPKDDDKKDDDKKNDVPPPKDVKKDEKKDEKKEDEKKGAAVSRNITVASLSPAVLTNRYSG